MPKRFISFWRETLELFCCPSWVSERCPWGHKALFTGTANKCVAYLYIPSDVGLHAMDITINVFLIVLRFKFRYSVRKEQSSFKFRYTNGVLCKFLISRISFHTHHIADLPQIKFHVVNIILPREWRVPLCLSIAINAYTEWSFLYTLVYLKTFHHM